MAEAAVDLSSTMSSMRYFCHQCSQETDSVLSDFTCPRCRSGFVEEVSHEDTDDVNPASESEDNNESEHMADILDDLYGQYRSPQRNAAARPNGAPLRQSSVGSEAGSSRRQRHSGNDPQRRQTRYFQLNFPRNNDPGFDSTQSLEGLFQHILTNVAQGQLTPREGGAPGINARGLINIDFPLPLFQVLHGNPGDYAWGEGGLNEIITQLLNQLDGSGPPPMPKEDIDKVPFVSVSPQQVEKNLQCTVCMEDFKSAERVRILECSHCYHNECIVPWLQMHATCPVCRKEFQTSRPNRESVTTNTNNDPLIGNRAVPETSDNNTSTQSPNSTYESTDDYD